MAGDCVRAAVREIETFPPCLGLISQISLAKIRRDGTGVIWLAVASRRDRIERPSENDPPCRTEPVGSLASQLTLGLIPGRVPLLGGDRHVEGGDGLLADLNGARVADPPANPPSVITGDVGHNPCQTRHRLLRTPRP
jgi:hypothetical protein